MLLWLKAVFGIKQLCSGAFLVLNLGSPLAFQKALQASFIAMPLIWKGTGLDQSGNCFNMSFLMSIHDGAQSTQDRI